MEKDKFEAMLALAEFGAKRMEQRRTTEFQIFISYITLIVVGVYVVITKHEDVSNIVKNGSAAFLCISLGLINLIYIIWQVGLGKAMENDATRRNYYLQQAETLTGRSLYIKKRGKNNGKGNEIIVNTNYHHQFCDLHLIWEDWSRLLLVGIPTILHLIFLFQICKIANYAICIYILFVLMPIGLCLLGLTHTVLRKNKLLSFLNWLTQSKTKSRGTFHERHKTPEQ